MPIPILRQVVFDGLDSVPWVWPALKAVPWLALVVLLKWFFGGARNTGERDMHGKVVLVTVRAFRSSSTSKPNIANFLHRVEHPELARRWSEISQHTALRLSSSPSTP